MITPVQSWLVPWILGCSFQDTPPVKLHHWDLTNCHKGISVTTSIPYSSRSCQVLVTLFPLNFTFFNMSLYLFMMVPSAQAGSSLFCGANSYPYFKASFLCFSWNHPKCSPPPLTTYHLWAPLHLLFPSLYFVSLHCSLSQKAGHSWRVGPLSFSLLAARALYRCSIWDGSTDTHTTAFSSNQFSSSLHPGQTRVFILTHFFAPEGNSPYWVVCPMVKRASHLYCFCSIKIEATFSFRFFLETVFL